jgi:heat shock protein HslJ
MGKLFTRISLLDLALVCEVHAREIFGGDEQISRLGMCRHPDVPATDPVTMAIMSTHRRARNLVGLAMLGAFALLASACATSAPGDAPTSTPDPSSDDAAVVEKLVGLWGESASGQPHLEFAADGTVTGSDGCNGVTTTYSVNGDRVDLARFASTLKACPGVDDWMRGVRAVALDGDVLVIMDATGTELGSLPRSS